MEKTSILNLNFPQNIGYFIFKSCFLAWWKPAVVLCVRKGGESGHFQLRGSRLLCLTCFTCGAFECIRSMRGKKLVCTCWIRVTFYKEYVLSPKPSQLWFESANGIKMSKESSVMERKVLYFTSGFSWFLLCFCMDIEGQASPGVFPCCILIICFCPVSQSCLPKPFPSAPILLLLSLVHLLIMTQITSFPSEKEKKRRQHPSIFR